MGAGLAGRSGRQGVSIAKQKRWGKDFVAPGRGPAEVAATNCI